MAPRIGEILIERKIISEDSLKKALLEHQKSGKRLGDVLITMGFVTERQMLEAVSAQQGIKFIELDEFAVPKEVIERVPARFAWHYNVMPVGLNGNCLTLAVSEPFDTRPIEDIEINLSLRVERVLSCKEDITKAIKKYYGLGAETVERILEKSPDYEREAQKLQCDSDIDIEKMAADASVIKLVNQILDQAVKDRATDIHIEPYAGELFIRYRIDGVLRDTHAPDDIKYLFSAIVTRIKIMSGLDIVERRLPQDGRAKVKIREQEYDLRVSIVPALHGENIVIRILPTKMIFDLKKLGLSAEDYKLFSKLLERPHGITLVTGPTGSGKSTTLYACLSKLNTKQVKIITIEDPIEYELKGIVQTQVNSKINLTFARYLRSLLRHDPDIMMVGEIRDPETAEITIQTSLTGHLVFSTLHTNDTASAVTRLVDMGIDPFLITSSVNAFVAQRLIRLICPKCKEKVEIKKEEIPRGCIPITHTFKGKGCVECNNTGYYGRTGIYEILELKENIKKMIMNKDSADTIRKVAIEMGMHTLAQDGWEKVSQGLTTLEEVMRATMMEE